MIFPPLQFLQMPRVPAVVHTPRTIGLARRRPPLTLSGSTKSVSSHQRSFQSVRELTTDFTPFQNSATISTRVHVPTVSSHPWCCPSTSASVFLPFIFFPAHPSPSIFYPYNYSSSPRSCSYHFIANLSCTSLVISSISVVNLKSFHSRKCTLNS